jgi:hypothetical protein
MFGRGILTWSFVLSAIVYGGGSSMEGSSLRLEFEWRYSRSSDLLEHGPHSSAVEASFF